jgi:hypothetical protein
VLLGGKGRTASRIVQSMTNQIALCQLCALPAETLRKRHGVYTCHSCMTLLWFAEVLPSRPSRRRRMARDTAGEPVVPVVVKVYRKVTRPRVMAAVVVFVVAALILATLAVSGGTDGGVPPAPAKPQKDKWELLSTEVTVQYV